jgi:hypothetical protein
VSQPLGPCPGCTIGASGTAILAPSLTLSIPCNTNLLGGLAAVQAFEFANGPCLGQISLSDTVDIQVQ